VKPEAVTAVVELLMMGVRTPETWCMMMHGPTNFELIFE